VRNLFGQAADGTGAIEQLIESPNAQNPTAVSPDGTRLVFTEIAPGTNEDVMMLPLSGARRAAPQLQNSREPGRSSTSDRTYDVSPDGRRFLMIKLGGTDLTAAPTSFVVVQNWVEELKRLVPTN
jgi:Tol biopolymer transport system component